MCKVLSHSDKQRWRSLELCSLSLVPRPSPKSGKRVWCSEQHLMSHGVGPYFIKNVIIAFLNLEVEFLTPQYIWTTTQPDLQTLKIAAKSIWDSWKQAVRQVFTISDSFQKYEHWHHAIIIRSSAIWLVISNPRSAPPHVTRNVTQSIRPSLHVREGLGTRLMQSLRVLHCSVRACTYTHIHNL